jgi:hypothetical protein
MARKVADNLFRRLIRALSPDDEPLRTPPRRSGPTPQEPPDETTVVPDLGRASANALEKLRRVRQHRRQRG